MSAIDVPLERGGFGKTARRDAWWVYPLLTFLGLGASWSTPRGRALQGKNYFSGPYLSPMYSPLLFGQPGEEPGSAPCPAWMPGFVTGAMLILWAPGGFRLTCYYYRGAYYKAFWADPPSCTVGEPRKSYLRRTLLPADPAEHSSLFPVHRADLPGAARHDVWKATRFPDGFGSRRGHAGAARQRDSAGQLHPRMPFAAPPDGRIARSVSRHPARKKVYDCVSCLNRRHMLFAWMSLFWVGFSDLYVRMCSMESGRIGESSNGGIPDARTRRSGDRRGRSRVARRHRSFSGGRQGRRRQQIACSAKLTP